MDGTGQSIDARQVSAVRRAILSQSGVRVKLARGRRVKLALCESQCCAIMA